MCIPFIILNDHRKRTERLQKAIKYPYSIQKPNNSPPPFNKLKKQTTTTWQNNKQSSYQIAKYALNIILKT